ncbi:MAG: dihydropteroate synthase [Paracoccaceae bacterium]|jgi:dihydropteroate synthase
MSTYFRPLINSSSSRPDSALSVAGGPLWFDYVEKLSRDQTTEIIPAHIIPEIWKERLCAPRPPIAGVSMTVPSIMGILNVTPDSFSDGGQYQSTDAAIAQGSALAQMGADFIDVGGESTRPGALEIPAEEEIYRIEPVIKALQGITSAISIDTRKAAVAEVALSAGAKLVNDVSGFQFDAKLLPLCAEKSVPVCVMHSQGLPETMQNNPSYDNIVLDVYDFLHVQIERLVNAGVPRSQIIADPGIGFGKTMRHNLALLQKISLFHGLGVAVLLGMSRKGFIGKITGEEDARNRVIGSVAAAMVGASQGVQIFRVHDVKETRQAFDVRQTVQFGDFYG